MGPAPAVGTERSIPVSDEEEHRVTEPTQLLSGSALARGAHRRSQPPGRQAAEPPPQPELPLTTTPWSPWLTHRPPDSLHPGSRAPPSQHHLPPRRPGHDSALSSVAPTVTTPAPPPPPAEATSGPEPVPAGPLGRGRGQRRKVQGWRLWPPLLLEIFNHQIILFLKHEDSGKQFYLSLKF